MRAVEGSGSTFKDTEIGPIPVEWEVVPLGKVATLQRGKDLPKRKRVLGPFPVIGSSGILGYHSESVSEGPGVLVGRSGSVGKTTWVGGDYWPLNTTLWVKNFHGNDRKFVYYLLSYFDFGKYAAGVSVPTLNRNLVHPVKIALPPLPEQRRIAHVLSTIQQAIAAQEDIIAAARETKRSLMHRLFTYGPGAEPAPTKETEIGEIPEHWEVVRVDDVFEIKLGKMLSKAARRGISPRLYLRNANVQWGYFDLDEVKEMDFAPDEMDVFRLRKDDILVCEGGEIGRTAIWEEQLPECYYQKALHRLRPKAPNILPKFFLYYMMLVFLIRQVSVVEGAKSTIAHLPVAKLRMVPVTLPPLGEQRQLVEQIGAVDSKIAAEEQRKAALQALFQSMLHQLMTGQVRVREAARLEPIASLHNGEGQG